METAKTLDEEDLIKLSQAAGVTHDLAEIMRENKRDIKRDERVAGHLEYITEEIEKIIRKYSNQEKPK